jgi:protocatechuate 3,4-dioxygenase beta subunit
VCTLEGTVSDEQGRPVAGAVVMFGAASPPHRDIAAVTDERGAFRFGGLAPGRYSVVARADGVGAGEEAVDVGDTPARVVVTLLRGRPEGSDG